MSKRGSYIGGHSVHGPNSSFFTGTTRKKAKRRRRPKLKPKSASPKTAAAGSAPANHQLHFLLTGFAKHTSERRGTYYSLRGNAAGLADEITIIAGQLIGKQMAVALQSTAHDPQKISSVNPARITLFGAWQNRPVVTASGARVADRDFKIKGFRIGDIVHGPVPRLKHVDPPAEAE